MKPQVIHTKNYGSIEIVKSWFANNSHIGELAGGGYVYLTGLPVKSFSEVAEVVSPGPDLEKARQYFEDLGKKKEQVHRKIVINPDGSCEFSDGSPVTSVSDLLQHIPPGPMLDAAYDWFKGREKEEAALRKTAQSTVGQAAAKVGGKTAPKKPPAKKVAPKKAAPAPSPSSEGQTVMV